MKNIFLVGGILAILFNSLIGLIMTKYPPFNWLLADVSIFLTAGLIYALYTKYLDNAFKTVFTFLFLISGSVRYLLCLFVKPEIENNWLIIILAGLFVLEALIFVFGLALRNK